MKEKQLYNVKRDVNGNVIQRTKASPKTSVKTIYMEDGTRFSDYIEQIDEAEEERVSAENARVSAENGRVSAENGRVSAEQQRNAAMSAMAQTFTNEQTSRSSSFNSFMSGCTGRFNQEMTKYDNLLDEKRQMIDDTVEEAETATNNANEAAEDATTAANNANDAATSASTAASGANAAKNAANTAASSANSAASAANSAAENALQLSGRVDELSTQVSSAISGIDSKVETSVNTAVTDIRTELLGINTRLESVLYGND